ncbi:MAG: glutathione S-transferase family protein, partial [Alsobacter sp.]
MALMIYGVLRSRATRTIWTARELGLAFTHVPVIQANRLADPAAADAPLNTASPAFLAINPAGQIPCIDDDGFRLAESFATTLYLARKHGGSIAPTDLREDAQMTAWTLWAATAVEPHALAILYNRVARPVAERDPAAADAGVMALARPFATFEAALAAGDGHPVGGRFTVADINLAEV